MLKMHLSPCFLRGALSSTFELRYIQKLFLCATKKPFSRAVTYYIGSPIGESKIKALYYPSLSHIIISPLSVQTKISPVSLDQL